MGRIVDRLVADWPAALAVAVLIVVHLALLVTGGDARPLGLPLFAAIVVFLLAELGRRLV